MILERSATAPRIPIARSPGSETDCGFAPKMSSRAFSSTSAMPSVISSWFSKGLPIAPDRTPRWTAYPTANITGAVTSIVT